MSISLYPQPFNLHTPNVFLYLFPMLRKSHFWWPILSLLWACGSGNTDSEPESSSSSLKASSVKASSSVVVPSSSSGRVLQFLFTADPHLGLTRDFRSAQNVSAQAVCKAMLARSKSLSVDFQVLAGDIGNRAEASKGIQSAAVSWTQFATTYLDSAQAPWLLLPGNHDVSNAIGHYEPQTPAQDPTILVELYNRMMSPAPPLTNATYQYRTGRIHYSREFMGIHFAFLHIWPDSTELAWLAADLQDVPASRPVLLFAHDPPQVDPAHFTNPNGTHGINSTDAFENLLDTFQSGTSVNSRAVAEERRFVRFLKAHTNIKAYFHGHSNQNDFSKYQGPDNDIALQVITVDSPMKGDKSAADETQLSFQIVSIDSLSGRMTIRECLWNSQPGKPSSELVWGKTLQIPLF